MQKYIGQIVTIIYQNRQNGFSKRRIKLLAVGEKYIKAYCLEQHAPRTLLVESVLAVEPVRRRMSS